MQIFFTKMGLDSISDSILEHLFRLLSVFKFFLYSEGKTVLSGHSVELLSQRRCKMLGSLVSPKRENWPEVLQFPGELAGDGGISFSARLDGEILH